MHEPDSKKRVQLVHKVVEISRPLWLSDAAMEELLRKFAEKMKRENRSMSDPTGGGISGRAISSASPDCSESDSTAKASRRRLTRSMMEGSPSASGSSKPTEGSTSPENDDSGRGGKTAPSDSEEGAEDEETGSGGTSDNDDVDGENGKDDEGDSGSNGNDDNDSDGDSTSGEDGEEEEPDDEADDAKSDDSSEDAKSDTGEPSKDGSEDRDASDEGMTPAQALRSAMEEAEATAGDLKATEEELKSAESALNSESKSTKADQEVLIDYKVKGGLKKVCDKATCKNIKIRVGSSKAELADKYNAIVAEMQTGITHLSAQIQRILRNDRAEKIYKTSGKISIDRLASGRLTANLFTKRRDPHNKCDADICILVDESGSMYGTKSQLCRKTAIALAESLRNLGISLHIIGFTADEGADAVHFHYMNGNNTRDTRLALMNISARSNNFDGYSIRYATEYMKKKPSEHKLMIIVSDGQPACRAYGWNADGVNDTALAIHDASKYFPVVGILIGNENPDIHRKMYGYNFLHINNPNNLFQGLAKIIEKQVRNW